MTFNSRTKKLIFYAILSILLLMTAISSYFILNYKTFVSPLHANYNLTIMLYNKKLTLFEQIMWKVYAKKYDSLIKKWFEPLVLEKNFNAISSHTHVRVVKENASNGIAFLKQYDGLAYVIDNDAISNISLPNIEKSTTGILPLTFLQNNQFSQLKPGTYVLNGMYYYVPQIKADTTQKFIKLDLGEFDAPVDDVTIIIKGKLFDDAFSNLLNQKIEFDHDRNLILLHGNLYDQKLQLILLTKSSAVFTAFIQEAKRNVPLQEFSKFKKAFKKMSLSKSIKYNFTQNLNQIYKFLVLLIIFIIPAVFYLLYFSANKPQEIELEEEIFEVPDPDYQPWAVNMLFLKEFEEFKTDHNAFFSVLLQLDGDYIKMDGNKIIILSDDTSNLDEYQERVLKWLIKNSKNNIVNIPQLVKEYLLLSKQKPSKNQKLQELKSLFYYENKDLIKKIFDFTEYRAINNKLLFPLLTLSLLLPLLPKFVFNKMLLFDDVVLFFSKIGIIYVLISFVLINLVAKKLYMHVSKDARLKALEWQEFRSFLQSPELVKSHSPTDVSKWKEWLYFASAFGIDKTFTKIMKDQDIIVSELNVIDKYKTFVLLLKKIIDKVK